MSGYPQRVATSILPLSVASTLPDAFEEWHFTGRTEDHEQAIEDCQLCGHEQLRYHFEIENRHTYHRMWVGSQCILKFNVAVYDHGRLLDEGEAKKKLDRLVKEMRLQSCITALEKLASSENNQILRNALDYYQKHKYLTPKFAFVVFWRLQAHNIDYSPSFFKVSLKRERYKNDLRQMPSDRVRVIWPALSASQRKMAISMGHRAPKS